MSNLTVVPIGINQDALKEVEKMVEDIRSGKISGFTAVVEHPDTTYTTMGSSTFSNLQTVGALMAMILGRLE